MKIFRLFRLFETKKKAPEPDLLYYIVEDKTEQYIKCMTCGKVSYNPTDIALKFCAWCNIFHETGNKRTHPGQTK